jgi:hypothetical protein
MPVVIAYLKLFQACLWKQLDGMSKRFRSAQTEFKSAPQVFKSAPHRFKSAQNGFKSAPQWPQVGTKKRVGTDIPNVFNACAKVCRLETVFCISQRFFVF